MFYSPESLGRLGFLFDRASDRAALIVVTNSHALSWLEVSTAPRAVSWAAHSIQKRIGIFWSTSDEIEGTERCKEKLNHRVQRKGVILPSLASPASSPGWSIIDQL